MNDTERVLMNIAIEASGSCHDKMVSLTGGWKLRTIFGRPAAQFLPTEMCDILEMPLEVGDIVRCETNRSHDFSISKFVGTNSESGGAWGSTEYLCQKIGSEELCRVHNERLSVLRFMPKDLLYVGKEKQIHDWCRKAFNRRYNPDADHHKKRCGGVDVKDGTAIVWSRAHIFYASKRLESEGEPVVELHAQPRKFVVEWNKKTRLKDIVQQMRDQGFALDYEYATEEPTEGMGGCCKMTRKDVVDALESSGVNMR
jgi:hypothetical protein